MGKKKYKHQGHYCKMCGEYKSNESFSGKGHRLHICKKCISLIPQHYNLIFFIST